MCWGGGGALGSQNPKCQDLPKISIWGGGVFWEVKTQSAKICLNFNFQGGWGWGERVVFWEVKTHSAKICLNFNFGGCVWGVLWESKTQSAKICLNFNWGAGVLGSQNPKCQDLSKFQWGGVFGGCSGKSKFKVPRSV